MKAMRKKIQKNSNQNPVQQLCPYEKVRENNIKERTELAKSLNTNQLSKWLKESLLPMSDDIYNKKSYFFYCSLLIFK